MLDPIKYDSIFYYKNIIQNPYEIIDIIEKTDSISDDHSLISKWKDWKTSSDDPYVFGKQKMFKPYIGKEKNENFINIYKILKDGISKVSKHYEEQNDLEIGNLSPLCINQYNTGSYMGPHCDTYSESSNATISVVLYLNDNYSGGELYFENQKVKIKPEAGSIVVFPSKPPYMHQSLEITDGIKYMCPGFWNKNDKQVLNKLAYM